MSEPGVIINHVTLSASKVPKVSETPSRVHGNRLLGNNAVLRKPAY